MSTTLNFYQDLPAFHRFNEVVEARHYCRVPEDWVVIITDVKGSTQAIAENRYKDVNVLGASSIVAILNAIGRRVPFVFGGDGATVLAHRDDLERLRPALITTRAMAARDFRMEIRAGIVPIADLHRSGAHVEVAKFFVSQSASLAMIRGGGLSLAEKWIKSSELGSKYAVEGSTDVSTGAIFDGLSCRWNPVPARRGEMLSLLVMARDQANAAKTFEEILAGIEHILGEGNDTHPVTIAKLDASIRAKNIRAEVLLRSPTSGFLDRALTTLKIFTAYVFVHGSYRLGLKYSRFDPKLYVRDLVASTDFRKFDDMLRMIRDCDADQRRRLETFLEEKRREGKILYGIHAAKHALMTCLVFSLQDHIHFIDGADGGYAMAAKQLKEQLAALRIP